MRLPPPLLLIVFVFLTTQAPTSSAGGSHEHGVAHVQLTRTGTSVEIHFEADGLSIVGFERAPQDRAERLTMTTAGDRIRQGADLFGLPGEAQCRLVSSAAEVPYSDGSEHAVAHHHAKVGGPVEHADWTAKHQFECGNPADAVSVDFDGLFRAFPRISRVKLLWITDDAQSAAELVPGRSRAELVAQ